MKTFFYSLVLICLPLSSFAAEATISSVNCTASFEFDGPHGPLKRQDVAGASKTFSPVPVSKVFVDPVSNPTDDFSVDLDHGAIRLHLLPGISTSEIRFGAPLVAQNGISVSIEAIGFRVPPGWQGSQYEVSCVVH
jgi:hypothetical protein